MTSTTNDLNGFYAFLIEKLKQYGFSLVFSLGVIIAAIIINKITNKSIKRAFIKMHMEKSNMLNLALKSSKYGIIIAAAFLILSKFNIPLTAFFTIISSIVVSSGLALQSFLGNVAKSVQIKLMSPFAIGDLIEVDSKKGRVKKIDYFHTYIVNEEHGLVMVPNALIADKSIINYTKREKNPENKNNNSPSQEKTN